ncbi:MAG: hypothetical protein ACLP8S_09905 [Solirubrobacteraceae bacterium]
MSSTTHPWQGGATDPAIQPSGLGAGNGASTSASLIGSTSDTCSRCGAGMAPDQRYCVDCGERRGKPRFTAAAATPATREAPKRARRRPHRMNASAGATLIAGVATLLLALGVGVLIGRSDAPAPSASKSIVVSVPGSAPATSGAASTAAASSATTAARSTPSGATGSPNSPRSAKGAKRSKASAKAAPVSATKATSAAAQQNAARQAAKTLGNSNIGNPTSQVGSACSAGTPGCQNGKQTPSLFGGG